MAHTKEQKMSEAIKRFLAVEKDDINALTTKAAERKAAFHRTGAAVLMQIARDLGYRATEFKISNSKGGPGVGGEVILKTNRLEIWLCGGFNLGNEILYRAVNDGRVGNNNWMMFSELGTDYDGCIERFKRIIERVDK
jgi:hypothetical protein